MAEIGEFKIDYCCDKCIINTYKALDRVVANNRRWRWRHAHKCGRRRR